MKIVVGQCSKGHQNLVVSENTGESLTSLKRYAKELGVYFNKLPQCYVCKEPFDSSQTQTVEVKDDASIDAAAIAIRDVLTRSNA